MGREDGSGSALGARRPRVRRPTWTTRGHGRRRRTSRATPASRRRRSTLHGSSRTRENPDSASKSRLDRSTTSRRARPKEKTRWVHIRREGRSHGSSSSCEAHHCIPILRDSGWFECHFLKLPISLSRRQRGSGGNCSEEEEDSPCLRPRSFGDGEQRHSGTGDVSASPPGTLGCFSFTATAPRAFKVGNGSGDIHIPAITCRT